MCVNLRSWRTCDLAPECSFTSGCDTILDIHDLEHLGSEFSQAEIDLVIRSLPNNHAPGQDGFNGLFIKKCWPIIQEDFTRLLRDFSIDNVDISSINSSFIALIPKKDNPKKVDDFRPISLLNYSLKCITKILSNMLQRVILVLVHQNQYGFIKGRTIQDCVAWAYQSSSLPSFQERNSYPKTQL